jgi:hypothetical protein
VPQRPSVRERPGEGSTGAVTSTDPSAGSTSTGTPEPSTTIEPESTGDPSEGESSTAGETGPPGDQPNIVFVSSDTIVVAQVGVDGRALAASWSQRDSGACSEAQRVYCFGVGGNAEVAPEPIEGRVAFTTPQTFPADVGVEVFDSACAEQAEAVGFGGSFRALVALTGTSPLGRFDLDGPVWVNTLGVPLGESALDLGDGNAITMPSFDASGSPVSGTVWVGAPGFASFGGENCLDWTTSTVDEESWATRVEDIAAWGAATPDECTVSHRVVCLQE